MCGLTGFIDFAKDTNAAELERLAGRMAETLVHRGPDDGGTFSDVSAGLAFGYRRLSILDLSAEGHQPKASESGRYVIVFNGEIYNFLRLRAELEGLGRRFRGRSDTEVMLAAFEQWGVAAAVRRLNGMFAFAVWDRKERLLLLARDRVGKKPLYYGWMGKSFLFGSELKALRQHPAFRAEIDRDVLSLYLRFCYVPAPHSIFRGIFKLEPGVLLTISWKDGPGEKAERSERYWSADAMAQDREASAYRGSPEDAASELEELLRDAVGVRMLSDVPLGALLSGGIDSSVVIALMQAQSSRPVRTFTIGFHEEAYNEALAAKAVAQHVGTDHTELYVTPKEARDVIPRLPTLYDEPFSDSSQIPTFLVCELARRHVTVCLSGDGGDELFGGYTRYLWGRKLWSRMDRIPVPLRRFAASAIRNVPPRVWDIAYKAIERVLPEGWRQKLPAEKARKFAEILAVGSAEELYAGLVSFWKNPDEIAIGAHEPGTPLNDSDLRQILPDFTERMMFLDLVTYLPDDILVKVDRASMGVSLEARCPLLDYRVVEFAWRLPLSMKIRGDQGKWILRQLLNKYVPPRLVERPKMGFGVPVDAWLRGPLRDWAEDLIGENRLRQEGFLNAVPIRERWAEHLSGRRNWQFKLWDILMFQAWLAQWR